MPCRQALVRHPKVAKFGCGQCTWRAIHLPRSCGLVSMEISTWLSTTCDGNCLADIKCLWRQTVVLDHDLLDKPPGR